MSKYTHIILFNKQFALQIHLQSKLMAFIWYMTTKETHREVSNLFGISENSCCAMVHAFAKLFNNYLLEKIVKWPNEREKREIAEGIYRRKRFPDVIGKN